MLLLLIIAISQIKASECVKSSGRPVPHADILDDLLSKFLGDSYSNSALFDFILGEPQNTSITGTAGDNLDISVLDVDSVRKVIQFAKKKHERAMITGEKSRRTDVRIPGPYVVTPWNENYEWHPYIINKTIDLMKQVIYMTRDKVNYTRSYREKFGQEAGYKVALLYGAAAAMLGKMESLLNQMKRLRQKTHFIWFLIIYEKILACNIDIEDTIEKMFEIQESFERVTGGRSKKGKNKLNMTAAELKELMQDPIRAELYFREHGIEMFRRYGQTRVPLVTFGMRGRH